jgi:hypothetical protein
MEHITVREWVKRFNDGAYENSDFSTQVEAGWYDWFCEDRELPTNLKHMGNIISKIKNDFLLDNYRVWFKNNCPMVGPLYDDFRFEPLNEGKRDKLYFGVACDDAREHHRYVVFTARNDYNKEIATNSVDRLISEIETLCIELGKAA